MVRLHAGVPGEHIGTDYQIYIDGEPISYVEVFSPDEGWAVKYCERCEHTDRTPHQVPGKPDGHVCRVAVCGEVEVRGPDGNAVPMDDRPWPWESDT